MTKKHINLPVQVTAVTFNKDFEPVPRRIEFEGQTLTFTGSGIGLRIAQNGVISRLFDMSDGTAQYRLRQDVSQWTLMSITR